MNDLKKICSKCPSAKICRLPPYVLKDNETIYCPCLQCIVISMCGATCEDFRVYMDRFTFKFPSYSLIYNSDNKPMRGTYDVS